jgi:hypothetical protein
MVAIGYTKNLAGNFVSPDCLEEKRQLRDSAKRRRQT